MTFIIRKLTLLLLITALAGCAGGFLPRADDSGDDSASTGDTGTLDAGDSGVETGVVDDDSPIYADPLDDPESPLATRVIYFEFDQASIGSDYMALLESHARYLVENPSVSVRLEGHTDERGSREYNIGLGDRRAQAVRRVLLFQGVADNQVNTVSYGEERSVAMGHDEQAWARNRRVELVYIR